MALSRTDLLGGALYLPEKRVGFLHVTVPPPTLIETRHVRLHSVIDASAFWILYVCISYPFVLTDRIRCSEEKPAYRSRSPSRCCQAGSRGDES